MLSNKDIINQFKKTAALLELHGANPFKVRAYSSAVFSLEKAEQPIAEADEQTLKDLGLSKGMLEKMEELKSQGSFGELDELVEKTPRGVIKMMEIKGLGPKKIRALWQDLQIESVEALLEAAEANKIATLKGFGKKTQDGIIEQIGFIQENASKLHLDKALDYAQKLKAYLEESGSVQRVELAGEVRRFSEVVETIELVTTAKQFNKVRKALNDLPELAYHEQISGPFVWRGEVTENKVPVAVHLTTEQNFAAKWFLLSSAPAHLAATVEEGKTLRQLALTESYADEKAIYQAANWGFVPAEMREGNGEIAHAKAQKPFELVEMKDLKGILHNHSTYSDGKNTLQEMAEHCRDLGYDYLGISDHSQSAFYANGLDAARIQKQHEEIEKLNETLAPFRIFKGIESDILNDGSLDYPEEVLASFDFIVASVHSGLKMDTEKATQRLLTAIKNPYTTILGHPTGRLLLKREGYPIDHQKVIDACAAEGVSIEINGNPWRLDLDWRWVRYALDKGVMISLNPDAHEIAGYQHMEFALSVGRKAGLTKEMTLNALPTDQLAAFFGKRKGK